MKESFSILYGSMSRRELPEGFLYGDEVARSQYVPPPRAQPRRRRRSPPTPPEVHCLSDALQLFQNRMPVKKREDVKLSRARIGATYVHDGTGVVYLVMFKREPYLKFGRHFPDLPEEERGEGILCNLKLVAWAAGEGITLVVIFPDARAYDIPALEFWDYYEKNGTDVAHAPGEIAISRSKWKRLF